MKTVIEMAREVIGDYSKQDYWPFFVEEIERFAELVRADEREACAKVCETEWSNVAERMYGEECAAAIRARSNT
jgi:hypothetical protein